MNVVSEGLEVKENKTHKRIFRTCLALLLVVFALTMSYPSSYFQIVKPVMADPLTGVSVVPASNIVNQWATYDIFLTTSNDAATTKINPLKTIQIDFPSSFNLAAATRLIERDGINSGTLSVSGTSLKYTVNNPVIVPAHTAIRLEIGRIIATAAGSFTVNIKTLDAGPGILDGPTSSSAFIIKSIAGEDVSKSFMETIVLNDNATGNSHGWNPDSIQKKFFITGIPGVKDGSQVVTTVQGGFCVVGGTHHQGFDLECLHSPINTAALIFTVTNLPFIPPGTPGPVGSSSLSASSYGSTPSSSPQSNSSINLESVRGHDQIASEFL